MEQKYKQRLTNWEKQHRILCLDYVIDEIGALSLSEIGP